MNSKPLVSIIIPTYNRAHLIEETLVSIISQTYQDWECIIVDDGSTDNTQDVVNEYVKRDYRFQFHHRPKDRLKGANACRNYGFELSKGEFVNWIDSDDIFSENKIENQINTLKSDIDIVTCKWGRFLNHNEKINIKELKIYKDYEFALDLLEDYGNYNTFYPSHVFLVSRNVISRSGLWNENLLINQDGEFFCRVFISSRKIAHSNDSYVLYRMAGTDNTSSIKNQFKAEHMILSWSLIESHLLLISKERFEKYIQNGKYYVFLNLSNDFKNLINDNKFFFREQIKRNSILKKIQRFLLK